MLSSLLKHVLGRKDSLHLNDSRPFSALHLFRCENAEHDSATRFPLAQYVLHLEAKNLSASSHARSLTDIIENETVEKSCEIAKNFYSYANFCKFMIMNFCHFLHFYWRLS